MNRFLMVMKYYDGVNGMRAFMVMRWLRNGGRMMMMRSKMGYQTAMLVVYEMQMYMLTNLRSPPYCFFTIGRFCLYILNFVTLVVRYL
jgi:hypothetical protein